MMDRERERRAKHTRGRRWYDGNDSAFVVVYSFLTLLGFAFGGLVGVMVGRYLSRG